MNVHHIGQVVKDLKSGEELWASRGFKIIRSGVVDRFQKVRISLARLGQGVLVELLEPLGEDSLIWNFWKAGGGFHHLCLETEDVSATGKIFTGELGFRQVTQPTPSIFDSRPVTFFLSKNNSLIELIQ